MKAKVAVSSGKPHPNPWTGPFLPLAEKPAATSGLLFI